MNKQAPLFSSPDLFFFPEESFFFKNIIEDRWSKYSVAWAYVWWDWDPKREAKMLSYRLKKELFFRKATHNSYARRHQDIQWVIGEWYVDDGEKWAWICILREMRKSQIVNGMIIVTRYYGWIKLEWDRFRHVIDAAKYLVDHLIK